MYLLSIMLIAIGTLLSIDDNLNVAAMNVMMVGNSYTNPVVPMVRSILEEVYNSNNTSVDAITAGGAQLQGWATDQRLINALTDKSTTNYQKYDTVILQDQSQVSGFHIFSNFQQDRINPVIAIDSLIQENGANTMLYMTWGRRNGDTMNGFYPDFKTMNRLLMEGYILYRDAISTPERPVSIAPVGLAFEAVYDAMMIEEGIMYPSLGYNQFTKLYNGDGSHASNLGSYLAACVIVATMTGEDPREWIWKPDSLNEEERDSMQEYAWRAIQDFASERHTTQQPAIPSSRPTQQYTCIDLNRKICIKSTTCKWTVGLGCEAIEVSFVETSPPTSQPTPIETDAPEEATGPPSESVLISASPTQVPTTMFTNEPSTQSPLPVPSTDPTNPRSANPTQLLKTDVSSETDGISPNPTQQSIESMKTDTTLPVSNGSRRNIPLSTMLITILIFMQ